MKTLQERLLAAQQSGALTLSDLHRWFQRPYHTVRSWVVWGCEPVASVERERIDDQLALLERLILKGKVLPMPASVTSRQRIDYIQQALHVANARLSKGHLARGRSEVRGDLRRKNRNPPLRRDVRGA